MAARKTVNRIFSRNDADYEMISTRHIVHVQPPVLGEELRRTAFDSGLDNMLEECRTRLPDRNPLERP